MTLHLHCKLYLTHELWDDPVKHRSLVSKAMLPGAQSPEVFCSLWHHVCVQLNDYSPQRIAVSIDVQKYYRVLDGAGRKQARCSDAQRAVPRVANSLKNK